MAYTLCTSLALGSGHTGLTDLRAQLVDSAGTNVGSAVSTGFVEIGASGNYLWTYTAFPAGHRGGCKFYSNAAPTVFLAFVAINPEEGEHVARLLGLSQDNWVMGDTVYDGNGNLTAATIYVYDTAAHATTHDGVTGLVYKWTISGVFSGTSLTLAKQLRVT